MSKQNFTKPDILLAELEFRNAQTTYELLVQAYKYWVSLPTEKIQQPDTMKYIHTLFNECENGLIRFEEAKLRYKQIMGLE